MTAIKFLFFRERIYGEPLGTDPYFICLFYSFFEFYRMQSNMAVFTVGRVKPTSNHQCKAFYITLRRFEEEYFDIGIKYIYCKISVSSPKLEP